MAEWWSQVCIISRTDVDVWRCAEAEHMEAFLPCYIAWCRVYVAYLCTAYFTYIMVSWSSTESETFWCLETKVVFILQSCEKFRIGRSRWEVMIIIIIVVVVVVVTTYHHHHGSTPSQHHRSLLSQLRGKDASDRDWQHREGSRRCQRSHRLIVGLHARSSAVRLRLQFLTTANVLLSVAEQRSDGVPSAAELVVCT